MKFKMLLILFLSFSTILNAQKKKDFTYFDKSIVSIPDSLTNSTQDIANYINSNFVSEENKVKAVYIWLAENIKYDFENMYSFNDSTDSIIDITIKSRKGICRNYAELFNDITNKMSIKSYVVLGYTKEHSVVNYNPHAWCVAMLDSYWYIFDPTWGAGFIKNSEFIKRLNYNYFKIRPQKALKSHMPFDPLWQLVDYPITNQEFCNGWGKENMNRSIFNYRDSLKVFEAQSYIERLFATKKRIVSNKVNSYLIYVRIKKLADEIQDYFENQINISFNSANLSYNEGINLLNRFIDFRNDHFIPDKGDDSLKQMMVEIENTFILSKKYLDSIETQNSYSLSRINHLYDSIEAAIINVNKQKVFLEKVLNTSKNYRKSLFYDSM